MYPFDPPSATPPAPARAPGRSFTCLLSLALIVAVALGAAFGAAGGYVLARRELAAQTPATSLPQTVSVRQESAVIDAVRKVKPAVVTVVTTLQPQAVVPQGFGIPFGFGPMGRQEMKASGSGVIIDGQGHIVTNHHVVDKAARVEVIYLDGTKAPATLVGSDQYNELAVLKVEGPVPFYAELGDSATLQEGETVIAIGSPLGEFRGSVTVGVVSGVNRTLDVNTNFSLEGLIQTDAAINHGNSGGPLVNLAGQVIGINTAIVRADPNARRLTATAGEVAEGLGFAIPSATVRDIVDQLITHGRVQHPYLGVRYQEITPAIAAAYSLPVRHGIFIQDVERGSSAAAAGIQRGDILTEIGGVPLDEEHSLVNILLRRKVGDEVTAVVYRGTQRMELKVRLAGR